MPKIVPILFAIMLTLNLIFIITLIFIERKKPVNALAWIVTITFIPIVGFFLYIVFGSKPSFYRHNKFKKKGKYDASYRLQLMQQSNALRRGQLQEIKNPCALNAGNLLKYNTIGAGSLYSENNDIEIFTDASVKYQRLIEDIKNAQKSVHLLYFIYRDDHIGRQIINLMTAKAQEGLKTRIIIDDAGSITTNTHSLFKEYLAAGGELRRFSNVVNLTRLNYRNHRKIAVIDGKIGYLGGMNIGDEYMGLKKLKNWRDTHMRMQGSCVYMLQIRFLMDWRFASHSEIRDNINDLFPEEPLLNTGTAGVQIVSSGPDREDQFIKTGYIRMIYDAKKSIYIQTPYFVPDEPFLEALKTMAMTGIEIYIMIPGPSSYDKYFVYQASYSYVGDLLIYDNVHIYLYNGFIHSKTVSIDEAILSIGTCNIDIRSFALHFEVNAFIFDHDLTLQHLDIFHQDMLNCQLLSREAYAKRPLRKKIIESIARLFTPLF